MRSGTKKLQMPGGGKLNPEEKYNLAYQNPAYQAPSVGASALTYVISKLKFTSVLDVGCGMGYQLIGFLMAKKKVKATEVCDLLLNTYLKPFVVTGIVQKARIQQLPFPIDTFDLVYCTDVLEHIPECDIDEAIKELVRVSKKYIFVTLSTTPAKLCEELKLHETVKPKEWWDEKWNKHRLKKVATDQFRSTSEGAIYVWKKY